MTTLEKLLAILADGDWHPAEELVREVSHRFSATVHVARQRGYRIEKRRVERSQFEYRLRVAVPPAGTGQSGRSGGNL